MEDISVTADVSNPVKSTEVSCVQLKKKPQQVAACTVPVNSTDLMFERHLYHGASELEYHVANVPSFPLVGLITIVPSV